VAPGGYYTNGASVCTADAKPHLFHGVDRDTLQYIPEGQNISASDFQEMASWHANAVRIATNQDFWLSGATLHAPGYPATIAKTVKEAEAAGLDVILDLHWSDCGNLGVSSLAGYDPSDTTTVSGQQVMADVNSVEFWKEVATMFKDDGHVLFELYNEPNGVPWSEWQSGGNSVTDCPTVGMQALYDAVRGTGAHNVVILGGLNYAFDLSEVQNYPIAGAYNLMYASHEYPGNDSESEWPGSFGYLAAGNIAPVITTEFGDGTTPGCTGQWDTDLINFAATNQMSWTAWAWIAQPINGGCSYPALLLDWNYEPTVQGVVVKAALAMDPAPIPLTPDAGPDADATIEDATHHHDAAHDAPHDAPRDGASDLDATESEAGDAFDDTPDTATEGSDG
jgi:endoglucanase